MLMSKKTLKNDNGHKLRSKRAKSLRSLTGLSRRDFAKETGIPPSSQQHWEYEKGNGLTEKGAKRLLKACELLGVYASLEWLMHGVGSGPTKEKTALENKAIKYHIVGSEVQNNLINQELQLISNVYKELIYMSIPDDSMAPYFIEGDYVAGNRVYENDISLAIGHKCIVLTEDGKKICRFLKKSSIAGHYTLVSLNPRTEAEFDTIHDIKLVSAAPVIWFRRKDPLSAQDNLSR